MTHTRIDTSHAAIIPPDSLLRCPPPKNNRYRTRKKATVERNPAMVITMTSLFFTWLSSWASTASSSPWFSVFIIPVVTATTDFVGLRPVAKALGIGLSTTATFGFGRSAIIHNFVIVSWSFGCSLSDTILAPILHRTSLSDMKYWMNMNPPMKMSIIVMPAPWENKTARKNRYTTPSKNIVRNILLCSPQSVFHFFICLLTPR